MCHRLARYGLRSSCARSALCTSQSMIHVAVDASPRSTPVETCAVVISSTPSRRRCLACQQTPQRSTTCSHSQPSLTHRGRFIDPTEQSVDPFAILPIESRMPARPADRGHPELLLEFGPELGELEANRDHVEHRYLGILELREAGT